MAGNRRVREAVAAVPREGAVAVALSGGVDSTVLLHAVATGPARPRALRALHVNHGLQAEAGAWERHCRAFAADLGVPLRVLRGPVPPGNLEAGARRARYGAWARALAADEVLLLAHHANDQAETVVWQLATGRAPVGMPRERPLGAGRLLRPLLCVRRETIAEYASRHGLAWVEDRTNADTAFDRNYVRHEILPRLEARYPGAVTAIAATAGVWSVAAPAVPLPVAGLDGPKLRQWLGAAASERCIDEILRQAGARPGATPAVTLPDGRSVRRHKGCLHVVAPAAAAAPSDGAVAVRAGCTAALAHGMIEWRRAPRGLSEHACCTVGYRSGGERLRPDGRGVSKELKALFQEAGVPPWRRSGWPLLHGVTGIVAVPGIALAEGQAVEGGWWPDWKPRAGAPRRPDSAGAV